MFYVNFEKKNLYMTICSVLNDGPKQHIHILTSKLVNMTLFGEKNLCR